jgi:hypothetical protein
MSDSLAGYKAKRPYSNAGHTARQDGSMPVKDIAKLFVNVGWLGAKAYVPEVIRTANSTKFSNY